MKKLSLILMAMIFSLMCSGLFVVHAAPQYKGSDLDVFAVRVPVTEYNEKYGYLLRTTGKWIIPPKFDSADKFTDNGLASVGMISMVRGFPAARYGYIDLQGNMVIKLQFQSASRFSEGLASVNIDGGDSEAKATYINSEGKTMLDVTEIANKMGRYAGFMDFHDGMAEVRGTAGTSGFLNKMGELVGEPKFSNWGGFAEDVAVVKDDLEPGNKKWGVIDKSGAYVIPPQYVYLDNFSEGLAAVQPEWNGKWGFIDKKNEMVIEPRYSRVGIFHNGLASVWENDKCGFINRKGEIVIAIQFELAQPFQGEIAKVQLTGKTGWIDRTGNWVIQPLYSFTAVYWPEQKIILDHYYYDSNGKKLDHYANHMIDANESMKICNYKDAEASFQAALKINPQDEGATWGLKLAQESQKEVK